MVAVRLTKAIENRLSSLAEKTGRTKSFYFLQALEEHLEV
jgi:RHH-type rel operon transcriptional repressor/antitoxin RelB